MFVVKGKIKSHRGRGTKLGYPTINLPLTSDIKHGVYAGYVRYNCTPLPAAIFVGPALSFNETEPQVEAHLLDWSGDFLAQPVVIEAVSFIRDNKKFESAEALQQQIADDISRIRVCLQESSKTLLQ